MTEWARAPPWVEHGAHDSPSDRARPGGGGPQRAGEVGPKSASTGAPGAVARWAGPESPETSKSTRARPAAMASTGSSERSANGGTRTAARKAASVGASPGHRRGRYVPHLRSGGRIARRRTPRASAWSPSACRERGPPPDDRRSRGQRPPDRAPQQTGRPAGVPGCPGPGRQDLCIELGRMGAHERCFTAEQRPSHLPQTAMVEPGWSRERKRRRPEGARPWSS